MIRFHSHLEQWPRAANYLALSLVARGGKGRLYTKCGSPGRAISSTIREDLEVGGSASETSTRMVFSLAELQLDSPSP